MRILRTLFLVAASIAVIVALWRTHWEARLSYEGTAIIDLPRSPIWSPPPTPSYEVFRSTFNTLPTAAASASIRRVFRTDRTFFDFALYLWAVCTGFGVVYLCVRRRT